MGVSDNLRRMTVEAREELKQARFWLESEKGAAEAAKKNIRVAASRVDEAEKNLARLENLRSIDATAGDNAVSAIVVDGETVPVVEAEPVPEPTEDEDAQVEFEDPVEG